MDLLADLLADDPATPRLTVYQEDTGARLDFSALTLDNWAAKVGNMLCEEFEAEPGETSIELRLPVGWQAVVIALGAVTAGIDFTLCPVDSPVNGDIVFCRLAEADTVADLAEESGAELVVLSDDPFGRGVTEIGKELPTPEAIDFGPTVRFYGDQFLQPVLPLKELVDTYRATTAPPPGTHPPHLLRRKTLPITRLAQHS